MYNRYIQNDSGTYVRIPPEEPSSGSAQTPPEKNTQSTNSQRPPSSSSLNSGIGRISDSLTGVLRHALDQFHLEHVDTGDLLLLVLLFLLFREDADEEILAALGLLLIL